ncbi:MAG TPA: luciferase family protein [Candidatus Bathyarchaeia archaeon]|nr:luciferase family protein [Candidatus Bathyarchaeia archaeon]
MPPKKNLVKDLDTKVRALDGVERRGSKWAYRTGEREFAHFERENIVDIRITRDEEKRIRESQHNRRVILRPKPSDWISFQLTNPKDVDEAFKLIETAWKNNTVSSPEEIGKKEKKGT